MHRLLVCQGCTHGVRKKERVDPRDGEALLRDLREVVASEPDLDDVRVEPVACLSSCDRSCSVAFGAPGKFSFVLAGLKADECVQDLVEFARQYRALPDGRVRKADSPDGLRGKVVARVPPLVPDEE